MSPAVTKRDLILRVAEETGTSRGVVQRVLQAFLNAIVDELAQGHRLEFRDFGVFEVVRRKPRIARNPRTKEEIRVPAKTVVHFKQGRAMKERVASLSLREGGSDAGEQSVERTGSSDAGLSGPESGPEGI